MKLSKFLNWKFILAAIVILIIIFFTTIVGFLVDVQWYSEMGYLNVFFTRIFTQLEVGVPIFIFILILAYLYLIYLKRQYLKHTNIVYQKAQLKKVNRLLLLASAIISLIVSASIASSYWYDILKFINSTSFNLADPLFNQDVSFYIFGLPVYKELYNFVLVTLILLTILTLIFKLIIASAGDNLGQDMGNVLRMDRRQGKELWKSIIESAGRPVAFMMSAIFLLIGAGCLFRNYDLVYSPRGVAFGASFTDVHVSIPFNYAIMGLSVLAAISIFYTLYKKKVKLTLWIIGIMIGASILQGIAEAAYQGLIVQANEIDKEKPYIQNNIKYTQAAYNLGSVEQKDFPAEQNLTAQDIQNNSATIKNIRINDFGPALDAYNQLQGIRYYYRFNDIDIDRYNINGNYTQVFLSAREMDQSKLGANLTWQNSHMVYTHGFGVAMSPVNTVTSEGQPDLIIKDIPPASSVDIKIDRPAIYFGELTDDYIITDTNTVKEMDYPSGDDNKYTVYDGSAGINLGGLNRLLFMFKTGDFNFLLSQDINSNSKIIINRNIMDRVQKIAPFLQYDSDPYLVINNGKLYWIIDAYTTTSAYPYSEPLGDINYIRNSVKVIVDAYNGTTNFYLVDDKDPLAVTYGKIFPGLFKSASEIPAGFTEHFRYPEDIFNVQLQVYAKYHMTDPGVFYNKEDLWSVPSNTQTVDQQGVKPEPSYVIMKLPDGTDEEFMLISPYTPSGKDNMIAWLGARMDGSNYGKLIVYKFPKQKVTYGPTQFKARINQDPTISKELSLWNQQGSSVINGTIITIPIDKSLLYIMPVYIKSSGQNSIPEVKRVVLGYGDNIVMEETLDQALNDIFSLDQTGTQVTPPVVTPPSGNQPPSTVSSDVQDLIKRANDEFNAAKEAQQNGDWTNYGAHLSELQNILNQLNQSVQ